MGAALGASELVGGVYDESAWAPIALGALAVALALSIVLPRRPRPALLVPLLGLWLWSLASSGWSDSADASKIAADRWLLYAAAIAVLGWIVGDGRRRGLALVAGASAGVLCVALWMLARMVAGEGPALFLSTRLNDPLGYVNGQASYLLVAAWPALALAERNGSRSRAVLAGAGVAALVALVGLGLLTQSRGWMIALAVVVVVVLALVPGRRRRAFALLVAGAAVAAVYTTVARVWRDPSQGLVTAANTRAAAVAIIASALAAGVCWALIALAGERFAPPGTRARVRASRAASALLAGLGVLAVLALAANASALSSRIGDAYRQFVHLSPSPAGARLLSGAGNRYDYWRVALIEFRSAPILGVGAGDYQPGYYLHRRTTEWITQPHSLELQTLAELGLVGAALLAALLIAVAIGARRTVRAARGDPTARAVAVGAGGAFAAWLVQTSGDWMHLIPGLTGIALAAAVALCAGDRSGVARAGRRTRAATVAITLAIAVAGALTIGARVLSLRAQTAAQAALGRDQPRLAIQDASAAIGYDPASVPALVLRAAGFARLDAFAPAVADLRRAIAEEPRTWTTWALLGDLLTRRGDRAGAHSAYSRALALDPREPSLKRAVRASGPRARARGIR